MSSSSVMPRHALRIGSALGRGKSCTSRTIVGGLNVCSRPARRAEQRRYVSGPFGYEQAKSLVYSQYGEPKDVLSLHNHSISPAHGNLVTVRFLASPMNPADINTVQGVYPSKPPFTNTLGTAEPSAVPGNEGVAEVLSAGSDAQKDFGLQRGDWVVMKSQGSGTWRTHAQLDASLFTKLSEQDREGISPTQAGTVSVNPCTAYGMLKGYVGSGKIQHDAPTEGEWFIQNGANSAVGRAAIQLGKVWGLKSINLIRARPGGAEETQKFKDELKSIGADIVVTEEEAQDKSFGEMVKEATNGKKAKIALNCVGGRSALSLSKSLTQGGTHITYGAMAKQPLTIPAGMLIFQEHRYCGFWVSAWSKNQPQEKEKAVKEVLSLTRKGVFHDTPMAEVKWTWKTSEQELRDAVQGTLEGFRGGKGVFVFEET